MAVKPGECPRLIYRAHAYRGRKDGKKGFDEGNYIRLLDAAHQQLGGPIVLVWDDLGHPPLGPDTSLPGRPGLADRLLPATPRSRTQPRRGRVVTPESLLANLTKHTIDQLIRLIKTRLKRIPALLNSLLAHTHLPIGNANYCTPLV